jgi:hypothetical protein
MQSIPAGHRERAPEGGGRSTEGISLIQFWHE